MSLSARGYPRNVTALGEYIGQPELATCISRFLAEQHGHDAGADADADDLDPRFHDSNRRVVVFPSAIATFYAPGDPSGTGGMRREWIRATPSWRNGPARYDCAYVVMDPELEGFRGLHVVRVRLFFSFTFENKVFPCALAEWYVPVGDEPDEVTGMWAVEPELDEDGQRPCEVIHLDTILRSAHLTPIYGSRLIPRMLEPWQTLDAFQSYFANKWIDYHAHKHVS